MMVFSGCTNSTPSHVGTQKTPVFPGAKLVAEDSLGISESDLGGPVEDSTVYLWTFETSASRDEVIAFYKEKFPQAVSEGDEDGTEAVATTLAIEIGNAKIREVTIEISDGEFSIGESVKD